VAAMQDDTRRSLFIALGLCACAVAVPIGGRAQTTGVYLAIPATATATSCASASPTPVSSAAIYQITNAGNTQTFGTITLYDTTSAACPTATPIWGPLQLGPGQTIVFGPDGIPLQHQLFYSVSLSPGSTAIGTTIVVTW